MRFDGYIEKDCSFLQQIYALPYFETLEIINSKLQLLNLGFQSFKNIQSFIFMDSKLINKEDSSLGHVIINDLHHLYSNMPALKSLTITFDSCFELETIIFTNLLSLQQIETITLLQSKISCDVVPTHKLLFIASALKLPILTKLDIRVHKLIIQVKDKSVATNAKHLFEEMYNECKVKIVDAMMVIRSKQEGDVWSISVGQILIEMPIE
ncbi:hypothetical protein FGO68_gene2849 [Halteria grandinella]|uniref:Uncharacterized protein n=1 Tax=Halteria grandinella TaxID=5974 RepID=A0A8J8T962_HALGN|nr:hypothetical protein FGO68_gene2849 [Halteria grandinella]